MYDDCSCYSLLDTCTSLNIELNALLILVYLIADADEDANADTNAHTKTNASSDHGARGIA